MATLGQWKSTKESGLVLDEKEAKEKRLVEFEALLNDEASCRTSMALQKWGNEPGREESTARPNPDPVRGASGMFQIDHSFVGASFAHNVGTKYHIKRSILNAKHWPPPSLGSGIYLPKWYTDMYENTEANNETLIKVFEFMEKIECEKRSVPVPTLQEFAASVLAPPSTYGRFENVQLAAKFSRIKSVQLPRNLSCDRGDAVKISEFIQKKSSFPWLQAGDGVRWMWVKGGGVKTPIELYTFIPLTDEVMWIEALKQEINWLLFGERSTGSIFSQLTGKPSLKLLNGDRSWFPEDSDDEDEWANRWGHHTEGFYKIQWKNHSSRYTSEKIDQAGSASICFRTFCSNTFSELVTIYILVDDRPTTKSKDVWAREMLKFKEGLSGPPGEKYLNGVFQNTLPPHECFEPRRYSPDGEGMLHKLDPTHRGFIQNRLAMVDFTTPQLGECLRNPYTLSCRVVETFAREYDRFVVLHRFEGGRCMLLCLSQPRPLVHAAVDPQTTIERLLPCQRCSHLNPPKCLIMFLNETFGTEKKWLDENYLKHNVNQVLAQWSCVLGSGAFDFIQYNFNRIVLCSEKVWGENASLDGDTLSSDVEKVLAIRRHY